MDILNKSCALLRGTRGDDFAGAYFDIELVALSKRPIDFGDAITLRPHASVLTARKPDLILVPSAGDNVLESMESLRAFIPWLQACAAQGARIVSLCTGAFLLAESGLLDGRAATTHWFFADLFRTRYPKVDLRCERLIVDEGNVITSGAATSFLDLVLYLVELYSGHDAAVLTAKVLLIEMGRSSQLPYTVFSARKMHGDRRILRVQEFIEAHDHREFKIDSLAAHAGMSVRNFDRRFRDAVGETPSAYLQKIRIEKARRLLENGTQTVEEIASAVGYEDERSFRRLFRALTDLSPTAYRRKYAQNLQVSAEADRTFKPLPRRA
jgi:transcriptional regulator GlxA family with amidase domain